MDILNAITRCLTGRRNGPIQLAEKGQLPPSDVQQAANDYVKLLFSAERNDVRLEKKLDDTVRAYGWNEYLAEYILDGLVRAIERGEAMGEAMRDAVAKAKKAAVGFASEHPYYTALIAIGILVVISPWVIEALGFGELGPIEGTFAAWWESTYLGNIPQGSLFSFFQRLGMVWRRYAAPNL